MEPPFTYYCHYCPHRETWNKEMAAQAASVYHVYDLHPEIWVEVCGLRPPMGVRPEQLPGAVRVVSAA